MKDPSPNKRPSAEVPNATSGDDLEAGDDQGKQTLMERLARIQKREALGSLAAGYAHDVNNMLGAIMGHASNMILQLEQNHESYPDAEQIITVARRVKRLTDRLLTLGRHPEHASEPLSLNRIVMDVMALLARTLPKSIVFKTRLAKNIGAESDRAQLEHLLLNLCLNARDALTDGGEILIQTRSVALDEQAAQTLELQPVRYSVLSVKDNGQGMEPDVLAHALEPFFSTKQECSGLGLTLAEDTARRYNGRITIDSQRGKGTEVKVYLPYVEAAPDTRSQPPAAKELVLGQGETILLVDDEKHLRQMAKRLLEGLGYHVLLAESGEEAEAIYRNKRNSIDLVILDVVMGGIGGAETLDRLKAIDQEVRILVSSGHNENGEPRQLLRQGVSGFIQKPYGIEEVNEAIQQALK